MAALACVCANYLLHLIIYHILSYISMYILVYKREIERKRDWHNVAMHNIRNMDTDGAV